MEKVIVILHICDASFCFKSKYHNIEGTLIFLRKKKKK